MAPAHENVLSAVLRSALTEETNNYRNKLLLLVAVCFLFWAMDLQPNELTIFGFKFTGKNVNKLPLGILVLEIYFIAMFVLYGVSDVLCWISDVWQAKLWDSEQLRNGNQPTCRQIIFPKPTKQLGFYMPKHIGWFFLAVGLLRFVVDFVFPVTLGCYIATELWYKLEAVRAAVQAQ